jgi:hypothetical protein
VALSREGEVSTTPKFGDEEAKLQISILRAQNADLKAQRDHYSQLNIEQCADLIAKDGDIADLRARVEELEGALLTAVVGVETAISQLPEGHPMRGYLTNGALELRAALTPKGGETEGCPECGGTDHDGRSHKP